MSKTIRLLNVDEIVTTGGKVVDLTTFGVMSNLHAADGHSSSASTLLLSGGNGTGWLTKVGFDSTASTEDWGTFGNTSHSFDAFSNGDYYYKFGGYVSSGVYSSTVNKRLFTSGASSMTAPNLSSQKYNPDGASSDVHGIIIGGAHTDVQRRSFADESVVNNWGTVTNALAGQWGASDGADAMFGEGYFSNDDHSTSIFKIAFNSDFQQNTWRSITYHSSRNRMSVSDGTNAFACAGYHKGSGSWASYNTVDRLSWSDDSNDTSWDSLAAIHYSGGAGSNGNGVGIMGGGMNNDLFKLGMNQQGENSTWGTAGSSAKKQGDGGGSGNA